ncbi:MAG: AMP-binding protein [Verrucomicrobiales bacterium]
MNGGSMDTADLLLRKLENLDFARGWEDPLVLDEQEKAAGPADWGKLGMPDASLVFQTSGSTGGKTHVVHSSKGLLAAADAVNCWLGLGRDDVFACPLPLLHVGGFGMWLRAKLAGARFVMSSGKWDATAFVRQLLAEKATVISLVPTQLHDIVHAGLACPPRLRFAVVGGGHLLTDLESESRQLGWPVLGSFGMTETCGQIATERPDLATPGPRWMPMIDGWEARATAEGILETRGPGLLVGKVCQVNGEWRYLASPLDDGWFATEDHAEIREIGGRMWLRPLGRRDDAIKIRGELVSVSAASTEIEGLARGMGLASGTVAIIDQPDPRTGAKLILVGEPDTRDRLPELIDLFNRRAPAFARIEQSIIIAEIPRTALGKLRRSALREMVGQRHP